METKTPDEITSAQSTFLEQTAATIVAYGSNPIVVARICEVVQNRISIMPGAALGLARAGYPQSTELVLDLVKSKAEGLRSWCEAIGRLGLSSSSLIDYLRALKDDVSVTKTTLTTLKGEVTGTLRAAAAQALGATHALEVALNEVLGI
ncbi:hypothetical protein HY768_07475 [candidate division TA06 bacterium]|uniref:Uncharacterized protein n=1 Tax=candidate division TA06 bacterium TaxID=2250710 RepID=A0A933IBS0_UNCT6|nr:hypothetical protein [candidate division TA06 bacterium]